MSEDSGEPEAPKPPQPSGFARRTVYLDAVEEALGKHRRGWRRPKRQLRDFAVRQLKRAEKLQRMLDAEITKANKGEGIDPVLVQAIQTSKALTDTMMNAIEQVRRSDVATQKKLGGLTEEQLYEVLKVGLERIRWTDEDKYRCVAHWFGVDVANVLMKQQKQQQGEEIVDG